MLIFNDSFSFIFLGTALLSAICVGGASISLAGVPSGHTSHHSTTLVKTDFKGIFSDIYANRISPFHRGAFIPRLDPVPVPDYFTLEFGPINAANNANGYMGYVSLPTYDANVCAQHCNTRAHSAAEGPCIYFNLWTASVNGTPTTNICSMYSAATDSSTATNTGQGLLKVTHSLGYSRTSLIQDGSFQDYTCIVTQNNGCPYTPSAYWTRFYPLTYDFVLINNWDCRTGTSCAFFFLNPVTFATGATLTYSLPLQTISGRSYVISLFATVNTIYPPPDDQNGPLVSVVWNGVSVANLLQVGPAMTQGPVTFFNVQATVIAQGNGLDSFYLKNGISFPHAMYVDDISLFEKWF